MINYCLRYLSHKLHLEHQCEKLRMTSFSCKHNYLCVGSTFLFTENKLFNNRSGLIFESKLTIRVKEKLKVQV